MNIHKDNKVIWNIECVHIDQKTLKTQWTATNIVFATRKEARKHAKFLRDGNSSLKVVTRVKKYMPI